MRTAGQTEWLTSEIRLEITKKRLDIELLFMNKSRFDYAEK